MKRAFYSIVLPVLLFSLLSCKTVTVQSSPSGANAKCGINDLGATPSPLEVNFFSIFVPKRVTLSKEGYASKTFDVSYSSPNELNVSLNRLYTVRSEPSGADLYINGNLEGQTPMEDVAMPDDGSCTVEVRKKGWLPAKMTVRNTTPVDFVVSMEQDGSGRTIPDLRATGDGLVVSFSPVFADKDVGENSPNVSSCKKLTNQSQTEFVLSFSLLPDGKTLVASILEELQNGGRTEYRANIWQLNSSIAGAPRKAVTTDSFFDLEPNPSADGTTLFFSTTRNGRLGIWNLNLNGKGGLRTVTSGNTVDFAPASKPGSQQIYYSAFVPGSSAAAYIWNRPTNGGMPEQLTEGSYPQWNPAGTKLLYIRGDVKQNKARIWICDADGGNQTMISSGGGDFNDIDARWSLDGKKIIFSSNRSILKDKRNYDIYIMDAEGSNVVQLTTNGSHDDKPVFAPDGKTIFFRSNRGLVWDIWTMQIAE